ncbi:MAG: DUF4129 domain-containing protein [Deltaproteobacteria bacterium]|nr:DUF4129 domain-containing protein [Deltaproteobacteria bacterium]
MKRSKELLVFLSGGFIALIWRYAWANFITIAISHRPFPLPEAIGTFGLASLVTFITLGRGWRIIWVLCLQCLGFALASLRTIYVFSDWSYPFLNPQWLVELFTKPMSLLEWFSLGLILFIVILFWVGGVVLARKPRDYFNLCARFDLGVCFFLVLFLTSFLIRVKGGTTIQDPLTEPLLFSFFLFSVLGIALARNQSHAHREFLPGYKGIGVMLSFTLVVLLFGAGVLSFLLPYLTVIAQAGYGVIKVASKPLGLVIVSILRFLLIPRKMRDALPPTSGTEDTDQGSLDLDSGWWSGSIGEILRYVIIGLGGLIGLILVVLLLWLLCTWLFSRTSRGRRPNVRFDIRNVFSLLIAILKACFLFCRNVIKNITGLMKHEERGAIQLYTALLRWGHRSGVPRFANETPREYGSRLKLRFPALKREITSIINAFSQTVYGGIVLKHQRLTLAQTAWRTLRSPVYWVQRLKVWFLGPDKDELSL